MATKKPSGSIALSAYRDQHFKVKFVSLVRAYVSNLKF